jgi:hypothetical protein
MNYKIEQQVKWWRYAGQTLPFVALAILVFMKFFDLEKAYDFFVLIISVTFFAVSVLWWWWAIDTIKKLFSIMSKTEKNLNEVKHNITEAKKIIKNDLGNW